MVDRLISVGDAFELPPSVKVLDENLPSRLGEAALSATIVEDKKAPTDGGAAAKAEAGAITVTTSGHSQMYGLAGDGALPGLNGQPARSTNNTQDSLKAALDLMYPGAVTTNFRARSGETAESWFGFNETADHGDIEFVWLDQNEAVNGTLVADDVANMQRVAETITKAGSQPVFLGGHTLQPRDWTQKWFPRAAILRRVAERYGGRYFDVSEWQHAFKKSHDYHTPSVDSFHFNDKGYALMGTRLAALLGPKGLHPHKVAPGTRLVPNDHAMLGGDVVTRTGMLDANTIRITAGQSVLIPVEAVAPVDTHVRFFSTTTAGIGTGRIRYALSKAGILDRAVATGPTSDFGYGVPVRGHTLMGGPDLICVTCDTGELEIEAVDFLPVSKGFNSDGADPRTRKSAPMAGTTIVDTGQTWDGLLDTSTPLSLLMSDGTLADARIDSYVTFHGGTGTGFSGFALGANVNPDPAYIGFNTGIMIGRESNTQLLIRIIDGTGNAANHYYGAFFTSGQPWSGILSVNIVQGSAQVLMNGVVVGTPIALGNRHYLPGFFVGIDAPAFSANSCTITAPDGCV